MEWISAPVCPADFYIIRLLKGAGGTEDCSIDASTIRSNASLQTGMKFSVGCTFFFAFKKSHKLYILEPIELLGRQDICMLL